METGTKKTRGSEESEREEEDEMTARERERDDLLRRGPRLARRPLLLSPCNPLRRSLDRSSTRIPLRPPPLPLPPYLSVCPSSTLLPRPHSRCPLCRPPLHDPPGCDYLSPPSPPPPLVSPSLLPTYPTMPPAATRRRTRTLGAPLLLAADAKAARRCIYMGGCEGGERTERGSLQRATGKLP